MSPLLATRQPGYRLAEEAPRALEGSKHELWLGSTLGGLPSRSWGLPRQISPISWRQHPEAGHQLQGGSEA